MRIFAIGAAVPRRDHDRPGITAVHVVVSEILRGLKDLGHDVSYQMLFNVHRQDPALSSDEEAEVHRLQSDGVRVLPPIPNSAYLRRGRRSVLLQLARLARVAAGRPILQEAYPALRTRLLIEQRIRSEAADCVLTIWSPEGVAATHGLVGPAKVAYHGDVDYVPGLGRNRDRHLFAETESARLHASSWLADRLTELRGAFWLAEFRRAHDILMSDLDVIANITASNVGYYVARGHPRSIYIRNLWRDALPSGAPAVPESAFSSSMPIRIVGHAGRLNSTTSTYGLRFLLEEVVPALDRELAGLDYRIEIIGAGPLSPALRPRLEHPRVLLRGFVQNLDEEIRTARVYLMLNNVGPFKVAHTRHLLAWSLGACLVAHADSRLAMPEVRQLENALLGSTADEIARAVRSAVKDHDFNRRIRLGGRRTYERFFTPTVVVGSLAYEIARAVQLRRALTR